MKFLLTVVAFAGIASAFGPLRMAARSDTNAIQPRGSGFDSFSDAQNAAYVLPTPDDDDDDTMPDDDEIKPIAGRNFLPTVFHGDDFQCPKGMKGYCCVTSEVDDMHIPDVCKARKKVHLKNIVTDGQRYYKGCRKGGERHTAMCN